MSTPSIFCLKKLRNLEKPRKRDADGSSPISRLPDEIILQIFNKLIDLKTLCFCYIVSRRFSSIVLQVDAISFTAPPLNPHIPEKNAVGDFDASRPVSPVISSFESESFLSAYWFVRKFKGVKSLRIELPSSSHRAVDNRCLFKWKVKLGTIIESFIFLSPNSISDKDGFYLNGNEHEEKNNDSINDMLKQNFDIARKCLMDVRGWCILLLDLVQNLQMLEKLSFTDLGRRGRLSLSGKKLSQVKKLLHSASETELKRVELPCSVSRCYIPVLKLPVSGYVMKGVYFGAVGMKDLHMKSEDGLEDKEEALYNEALMEILENHRDMILTVVDGALV